MSCMRKSPAKKEAETNRCHPDRSTASDGDSCMDATNDRFVAREMSSRHPHRCAHRGPLSQDGDDVVVERLSLDELRQSLGWPVAGRRPINNTPLPPPRLGALVNGFYNKKGDSPSAPPWPGPIRQEETVLFALIERSQFPAGGGGEEGGCLPLGTSSP